MFIFADESKFLIIALAVGHCNIVLQYIKNWGSFIEWKNNFEDEWNNLFSRFDALPVIRERNNWELQEILSVWPYTICVCISCSRSSLETLEHSVEPSVLCGMQSRVSLQVGLFININYCCAFKEIWTQVDNFPILETKNSKLLDNNWQCGQSP